MNEKVDIFMPIYIGDYMADTSDLTTEEHGAYFLILMAMWRTREALPLHRLRPIAKVVAARWAPIWEVISRFFDVDAEGLVTQRRLWRELEAALEKKRRASDRGRKGGLARAQAQADSEHGIGTKQVVLAAKPLPSPSGDLGLSLGSSPSDPSASDPDQTPARSDNWANLLPDPNAPPRHRIAHVGAATPLFLECFALYPRKDAMQRAAQTWQDIALDHPGGEVGLHAAIVGRFKSGMLSRPPYHGPAGKRPYFETFLAQRRWEDPESAPDDDEPPRPSGPAVGLREYQG